MLDIYLMLYSILFYLDYLFFILNLIYFYSFSPAAFEINRPRCPTDENEVSYNNFSITFILHDLHIEANEIIKSYQLHWANIAFIGALLIEAPGDGHR